jgi:MFS family permease
VPKGAIASRNTDTLTSYAVDSLLTFHIGVTNTQVVYQFQPAYTAAARISLYIGLLAGALFWGISADIIGRKWAFNLSLFAASIFTIAGGASPEWVSFVTFNAISAFGAGGNLVLDTTVFLEYLPYKDQWLVVLMAVWWGVGQTVAALLAWAFMRKS